VGTQLRIGEDEAGGRRKRGKRREKEEGKRAGVS